MKPVLMVHGFGDSHLMPWWDKMELQLAERGYDVENLDRVNLGNIPATTISSPKDYAREVREHALDLKNRTGQDISIISHSMGGIDSRYFIEVLNGYKIVDNLVTIGSPHHGTKVAKLGFFSGGGRNMKEDCDLIRRLNKNGLHEDVNYTALWGSRDLLIRPLENAKLPEKGKTQSDKNIKVNGGHMKMLLSKKAFELYEKHLSRCKI